MRLEDLEQELRAERPDVDPEFARKLDDWAAAGFPRGGELDARTPERQRKGRFQAGFRRAWARLTSVPPRRLIAPVGAMAVLAVVVGVAVSGVNLGSPGGDDAGSAVETSARDDEFFSAGGEGAGSSEEEAIAPTGGGAAEPAIAQDAPTSGVDIDRTSTESAPSTVAPVPTDARGDGVARGTDDRIEDKTARLRLGAPADEVQEVANRVVEVTDSHDGFVLDSQVTSDQGGARASFQLEIPVAAVDATIADLSELGDVISRTEASEDITQRYVRAEKERARILDRIQELRIDLIQADTREERLVIKSQIDSLEAQADAYEAQGNQVQREARFATVAVEITSSGPDTDDGWSLGDAVDDAGDVLRTIAGVGLVTLAVLAPIALIGALAFWISTTARRRGRERALDA